MEMETEDQLALLSNKPMEQEMPGGRNSEEVELGSSTLEERLLTHQEVTEKNLQSICGLSTMVPIKDGRSSTSAEVEVERRELARVVNTATIEAMDSMSIDHSILLQE